MGTIQTHFKRLFGLQPSPIHSHGLESVYIEELTITKQKQQQQH